MRQEIGAEHSTMKACWGHGCARDHLACAPRKIRKSTHSCVAQAFLGRVHITLLLLLLHKKQMLIIIITT